MPAQPHRSILLLMPLAEGCATERTDNPFGRSTDDAERRPQPHHGATIAVIFSLQRRHRRAFAFTLNTDIQA
jgi:hypothetical protein